MVGSVRSSRLMSFQKLDRSVMCCRRGERTDRPSTDLSIIIATINSVPTHLPVQLIQVFFSHLPACFPPPRLSPSLLVSVLFLRPNQVRPSRTMPLGCFMFLMLKPTDRVCSFWLRYIHATSGPQPAQKKGYLSFEKSSNWV